MKLKTPPNLFNPCKKILKLFKFKLRKPIFITSLRRHRKELKTNNTTPPKTKIRSILCWRRKTRETSDGKVMEMMSFPEDGAPHPSPLTPAYVKMRGSDYKRDQLVNDVEEACRSFENYLIEMMVEEKKIRVLKDVEEFLYCWNNLECPVFTDLVCRFYGELCKDLFSNTGDNLR